MTTNRQKNMVFSVQTTTIANYGTGEPIVAKTFDGGNATLNIEVNIATLNSNEFYAGARQEITGGNISFDATIKEAPTKLFQIANQGTLTSVAACASAIVGALANKTGTSVTSVIISTAVSAGQHASVVRDKIYIEALSTSTFKVVNYSKGQESATIALSGAATRVVDDTVAPGVTLTIVSASALVTGDTAMIETTPIHGGDYTTVVGGEKICSTVKYAVIRGTACNSSDNDKFEFELYKSLISGVGAPLAQGDYLTLSIHAEAEVDDSLSTPAAGFFRLIKGA